MSRVYCSVFISVSLLGSVQAGYVDIIRDDPGLVSYWSFEEAEFDGNATDFTGLSDAPYGAGMQPVDGIVGQGVGFTGQSVIEVPNPSEYDFTEGMSVEAWFKTDSLNVPWQSLIGKGDSQWRLHRLRESPGFTFGTNDASSPTDMFRDAEDEMPVMNDGEWHHIVGVFDFENTQFLDGPTKRLYLDGELVGEQVAIGPIRTECGANCDFPVMIGGNSQKPDDGFRAFVGVMDEVAIYNRPLEDAFVMAHYLSAFEAVETSCDFDGNGSCDVSDIDSLMSAVAAGTNDSAFDLDGNGSVTDSDRDAWLAEAANENGFSEPYLVGDSNLDGSVNASDLNALALKWQTDTSKWSEGNYTGSKADAQDLNAMALNWQQSIGAAAPAAVPEPSSLSLLWIVGIGSLMCRNRRH